MTGSFTWPWGVSLCLEFVCLEARHKHGSPNYIESISSSQSRGAALYEDRTTHKEASHLCNSTQELWQCPWVRKMPEKLFGHEQKFNGKAILKVDIHGHQRFSRLSSFQQEQVWTKVLRGENP